MNYPTGCCAAAWLAAACMLLLPAVSGNRFQEAFVMNCEHTFPDGVTYDLSPLTRSSHPPVLLPTICTREPLRMRRDARGALA